MKRTIRNSFINLDMSYKFLAKTDIKDCVIYCNHSGLKGPNVDSLILTGCVIFGPVMRLVMDGKFKFLSIIDCQIYTGKFILIFPVKPTCESNLPIIDNVWVKFNEIYSSEISVVIPDKNIGAVLAKTNDTMWYYLEEDLEKNNTFIPDTKITFERFNPWNLETTT